MRALALHGFLGAGADWDAFRAAAELPDLGFDAPDLPGHGPSPARVPPHFAAWTRWVCERLREAPAPVHLLGYSMGGRLALAAAVAEASTRRVASLTLLGASPGLPDPAARRARAAADAERATRLAREGLAPFLHRWYRQPLFAPAAAAVGHDDLVSRRLDGDAHALAAALRAAGTGVMPDLRPGLRRLGAPLLAMAGRRDRKFRRLGHELAGIAPHGRVAEIDDAGHALLIEAPVACARLWTEFVTENANPGGTPP